MKYSQQEIIQYVQEEDVKFIRLAFCDVFGKQKNISIMPDELPKAFTYGIAIDASAIDGFGDETHSDLFLHPEPDTLMPLPWRPEEGSVVRMFCNITYPNGTPFEYDSRMILKQAIEEASKEGLQFFFGTEQEFYLFQLDDHGEPTKIPYDHAGYMDIAPEDKGENIRREICLTLEQMGIRPESSHHEQGNGFHINISVKSAYDQDCMDSMIAGILDKVSEMTLFLNPLENSYERFGQDKAPRYISWSSENRSQLVRVPAALGEYRRAELRSPDPAANSYLAFALLIYASMYGIKENLELPEPADLNLFKAPIEVLANFRQLPGNLPAACQEAKNSSFIKKCIPKAITELYCSR